MDYNRKAQKRLSNPKLMDQLLKEVKDKDLSRESEGGVGEMTVAKVERAEEIYRRRGGTSGYQRDDGKLSSQRPNPFETMADKVSKSLKREEEREKAARKRRAQAKDKKRSG